MPRTPPRTQPARPQTGSVRGQPTEKKKEDQEQQRVAALVRSARMKKSGRWAAFAVALDLLFSLP
ncbi:hypothetical protein, partial [Stenotrophomonas maltophilia]|uniref:hypothetical protein n=1 Tax=Stenotrophomonas maltophilia TaxID=40324 RepID=UPI00195301E2